MLPLALMLALAAEAEAPEIPKRPLALALEAFERARAAGHAKKQILTLIDYSRPSTERRLWVIDLKTNQVLFHELVAHGKGSGENYAKTFSNAPRSRTTSLGAFETLATYRGKHGYSLKLRGLDRGVNDNAEVRAIVIHGASYVSEAFAKQHGRLGRSWGCPALDDAVARKVIDAIKDGSVLFAYHSGLDDGLAGDDR
jgi:L,D-transpeptidase catalytic domain